MAGHQCLAFQSPREFLDNHDPSVPGCAVIDLTMPGLDGLELQQRLLESDEVRPIIFLSGHGDIASSVHAMKAGAIDFLVKPVRREKLLSAIARAEEQDTIARETRDRRNAVEMRLAKLTPREREVLDQVVLGRLNKQIAAALGTVEKTIKVHRGRMMAKLEVRSVAELVTLIERNHVAQH